MADEKSPETTLSPKQELFCQEYLKDLNATQAAIRAGYSEDSAGSIGWENLKKPEMAARIQSMMDERAQRTHVTADRVIKELAKLAFSDMRNFTEWGGSGVRLKDSRSLSDDDAACVAEVTETTTKEGGSIRFKLHDKKASLELLGKHLKLFTEKHEHTGANGGPIVLTDEQIDERLSSFLGKPKESKEPDAKT